MKTARKINPLNWAYLGWVWLVILFVLMPLATTVWTAFFSNKILSLPPEGYTAAWFLQAWNLADFRNGFFLSLQVAAGAAALALVVGVPAALAIARNKFPVHAGRRDFSPSKDCHSCSAVTSFPKKASRVETTW